MMNVTVMAERFSFRYPAVIILAFILPGTALGYYYSFNLAVLVSFVFLSFAFFMYSFFPRSRVPFIIPLGILIFTIALGQANLKYHSHPANDIAGYIGLKKEIRFFGEIDKWPVLKRHRTQIICRVDSIVIDSRLQSAYGLVLVQIQRETTSYSLGDRISFSGRLNLPSGGNYPGRFDYSRYLQTKGISGVVYIGNPARISTDEQKRNFAGHSINSIRHWILDCFYTNMRELPAALASGFLVGETHDIPPEIYKAFRRTGTMHLLAVSGSNVILVLIVIGWVLRFCPLGRSGRFITMLIVIIAFSHLSYNQPSVIRASVMVSLVLTARFFYRRVDLSNIIALAASALIFYDPGNLFDIGFQLSFAVTWGLVLFLPKLNLLFEEKKMTTPFRYMLLILFSSIIASLISAPILIYYFGEIPLITVFSNLLIVPLVSVAVIGIVILLLVHFVWPAVAIVPGMLLDRLLNLINELVVYFGDWKISMLEIPSSSIILILLYIGALFLIFYAINSRPVRRFTVLYLLVCAVTFIAVDVIADPSQEPSIEIFNRGSYQTLIINHEDGLVITNESKAGRYDDFNANLLPYLANRGRPFPATFAFFEQKHKTKQKLDVATEISSDLYFQPIGKSLPSGYPSIWRTGEQIPFGAESDRRLELSDRAIMVRFSGGFDLLFCTSTESWLEVRSELKNQRSYQFVIVRNNSDLQSIIEISAGDYPYILLTKRRDSYKLFKNNQLQDDSGTFYGKLIDKGEYFVIPCGGR